METQDEEFYVQALNEAKLGLLEGGIPIGAVLVYQGEVIGRGHNQRVQMGSATRHGEMDCLERAGVLPASVYAQSTLYTTLSPCSMCSGTILLYKIPRIVIGENINFKGEEALLTARGVHLDILNDPETIAMMGLFIQENRDLWGNDIGEK